MNGIEMETMEASREDGVTQGRCGSSVPGSLLDSLLEGYQVIDPDYRYLYVNDAAVRQGRTSRQHLLGRQMTECYPGIEATEMFSALRRCMTERLPEHLENEALLLDGSTGFFQLRFEPVPEGVAILSIDVTEQKRAQSTLRRTLRALTTLSRCNQTLVRAKDEHLFIQDVCDILVESGGYRSAWIELLGPRGAGHPAQAARAGSDERSTGAEPRRSFEIRADGAAIGALTLCAAEPDAFAPDEQNLLEEIAVDLGYGIQTLRARLVHASTEEQLVAAQRLEAVGRLAGGVAHDFNNLLSVILTYSELAMAEFHEADPVHDDIAQIQEAGRRATALTRQLLAFSRKQILEPQVTNVNRVVGGIESMLRRLLGEDIEIEVHPYGELGNVLADPGQLEQVIMNLAVNARDAMPEGGKLTIETDNVELDEQYAAKHLSARPGQYVQLSVTDNGTGMSAATKSHIFEPFFTTKEKGKGTGLGLSMVYGIVKQSGGNIWVYSELGHGTTFKVYLPRVDAVAIESQRVRTAVAATGNETILLVEDESAVRIAAERILRAAGYRVIAAKNGGEALLLCEKRPHEMDMLLTDVVMPEMSGRDLSLRLQALNPALKVLFTSGYTDDAIVHHGILDAAVRFISKPFSAADLTRKVREVLDEA